MSGGEPHENETKFHFIACRAILDFCFVHLVLLFNHGQRSGTAVLLFHLPSGGAHYFHPFDTTSVRSPQTKAKAFEMVDHNILVKIFAKWMSFLEIMNSFETPRAARE